MLNKIKGGLFGVAVGDALGGTTEFMTKEEIEAKYGRVTDIIGGGVWDLKEGEVTDDTEMTIAVIKGIIANPEYPIEEIGKHFLEWKATDPKDIGITIRTTFENYQGDWFKAAEKTHYDLNEQSAGNGSLMRCLPIALAYKEKGKMNELSTLQSKMTHFDDLAAEACLIYNNIASRLLQGERLDSAIRTEIANTRYELDYKLEPDCPPDGYVVNTMKWVLYWLINAQAFEEVVVGAANMGHDSDTVAAIAGGLKGIEVGFDQIPRKFSDKLLCRQELMGLAEKLTWI
ncbi:ADP-ribosyl-[dinitrogen reductase] hydrolase [Bacillus sp. DNRA2]|uniref:ADP-ribosylglycohydrolase family protein n=1 Tax=Bacillus sp. DNRA2 TaxID=2723053 RepID=UPI00145FABC5|nr:ADP-ribosylglycohydrolase family protein [Bacillus sp. DNRA2]NMD72611.1 ADP-ribosyl-[dinitrogen reductase] hydrolase [Bacillus sp. DNRA2]